MSRGMRFCRWVWKLSFWMFGCRPSAYPTVGFFWTRLALSPLLLVLCPIYWLIIGGPATVLVALLLVPHLPTDRVMDVYTLGGLAILFGWTQLFFGSRPDRRYGDAGNQQILRLISWPFRLIAWPAHAYVKSCQTPLRLEIET